MIHQIVIGAGYGDEGKGRMIDYFANLTSNRKLVVRFNGGSQAGHNVVLEDGRSHIHSHLSSGSLSNHDTYLSEYFVCNPITFLNEWESISTFFKVFVDPTCKVTTPFDIAINQGIEQKRGKHRHGSVGVGFGETIERYENYGSIDFLTASKDSIKFYLESIKSIYYPLRCNHLGIIVEDIDIEPFMEALEAFKNKVIFIKLPEIQNKYEQILFEGAQGLMLDMDYGQFPHVTRSNTGLSNAIRLVNTLDDKSFNVCYVTRSYATRHGAGKLANEDFYIKDMLDTSKETNVHGDYQGTFRYAPLDFEVLKNAIDYDLFRFNPNKIQLAVTCFDQWKVRTILEPIEDLAKHIKAAELYLGYGQNREKTELCKF